AVTDHMTWRFVPGEGVSHLTGDPLVCRIGSHSNRDESPAGVTQNHQAVEELERDRPHHEQIQRSDAGNVIAQEGLPALRRWSAAPDHIPADRLIRRPRFRASTIRHGYAVLPTVGLAVHAPDQR